MIQFFSINDFTRYIALFVILVLIRSFFWALYPEPFLIEIHYQNIVEQLNRLGESYVNVLHQIGPLSAGLFRYVYGGVGESVFLARLIALLVCYIQVLVVTVGINNVNGLRENNSFFGVIHIVLLHLFPDMLVLSPLLMGMTVLSITYVMLFSIIRDRTNDGSYLFVGVLQSLAVVILFPLFIFTIPTLLVIVFYTRFNPKFIGLYLLGLVLPMTIVFSYYFFNNYASEYFTINFFYGFSIRFISQVPFTYYFIIGFVPIVLFTISFFKVLAMYNMVNYQQKMIVTGTFFLVAALVIFFLLPDKSPFFFFLFIPFAIHFFGILFIESRYEKMDRLAFLCFFLMLGIPLLTKIDKISTLFTTNELLPKEVIPSYGRVLNLSDDKNVLANNHYATGFCDFMIARNFFLDKTPESSILVYNTLEKDLPDAIYDPNHIVASKFKSLPMLAEKYKYFSHLTLYRRKI